MINNNENDKHSRIYNKKRWRKKRERILKRDKYLCQLSLRYGEKREADTIHHIFPVEYYPELRFVNWNLISLSKEMHNRMHSRDSHNLTREGRELQDRYRYKYINWCKRNNKTPHF